MKIDLKEELEQLKQEIIAGVVEQLRPLLASKEHDKPMNVEEVAVYLHKSVGTVYSMTHLKQIPYRKQGNRLLFDKKEIDEWLEQSKIPAKDGPHFKVLGGKGNGKN